MFVGLEKRSPGATPSAWCSCRRQLARQAAETELHDVAVLKDEFHLPWRKSLLVGVVEFRIAIFAFLIIKAILGIFEGGTVGAGIL